MIPLLNNESFEMKNELLKWFVKNLSGIDKQEAKSFVDPLINCLIEKNKDIRISAEIIFEKCVEIQGINVFAYAIKNLKPVFVQQLKPLIEKYSGENSNALFILEEDSKSRNKDVSPPKKHKNALIKRGSTTQINPTPTNKSSKLKKGAIKF